MLYSADASKAADKRTTQYFEMFGNRAIYHQGLGRESAASIALVPAIASSEVSS